MTIQELYARKGELITHLEIIQRELREVDSQIVEKISKDNQTKAIEPA